jgi:branched-chain amino acid transport system permease protein
MLGINTTRFKVAAFALSAIFAACAGGIIAYQDIHVAPDDFFKIEYTLQMIIACIIGGAGTAWGPLVGAAVYQLLSTYVWSHVLELHPTVLGLIIILFVVFLPRGLMEPFRRRAPGGRGRRFSSGDLLANIRASRLD